MGIFFRSSKFVLTVIIGALAFAATAVEYPGTMNSLLSSAESIRHDLSGILTDRYRVWVNILLGGSNLVLMGFIIVTRIVFAIIGGVLGPFFRGRRASLHEGAPAPSRISPFNLWGRRVS